MAGELILVVDDEEDILKLVDYNLSREGFRVQCVDTGEKALAAAAEQTPDLIVLDLMLPAVDGLEVCRRLKSDESTADIPVVMLTAKGEEADIVAGLELGADDYVTKPFSPRILVARAKAVLRRNQTEPVGETELIVRHGIRIDPGKYTVAVEDRPVDLTITEFRILHCLARRSGWVFTRYQLVDVSRGEDSEVTDRSVDVHIVSLRRKLGAAGSHIETVRGVGYRFAE